MAGVTEYPLQPLDAVSRRVSTYALLTWDLDDIVAAVQLLACI